MGSKQKVSVTNDLCIVTMTTHMHIALPPGMPPPVVAPHLEMPVTIFWPPGMGAGQNKVTSSVFHRGMPMALEGHDCGILIPHTVVMPAPTNALLVLIIPFSSRKMMFSASTVKMDGTATGTSDLLAIPTPMMACAEPVNLPVCFPLTNATNTVNVGMDAGDFIAGYAAIALSIAADVLTGGGSFGWGGAILGKLLGAGDPKQWAIKTALGIATGVVKIVATGEGTIEVGLGGPYGGSKVTVSRKKDGTWTLGIDERFGDEGNARQWDTKGNEETTETENDWFGTKTTKTTTDENGNVTVVEQKSEYDIYGRSWDEKTEKKYDKEGNLIEVNGKPPEPDEPPWVDVVPETQDAAFGEDEPL